MLVFSAATTAVPTTATNADYGHAGGVTPCQKAQAILDAVREGRGTVGDDRAFLLSIVDDTLKIEE